jgi:DNA-3-methyladenine glycosylase I
MTDYQGIFSRAESMLITMGGKSTSEAEVRKELDKYKLVGSRVLSDGEYFRVLVASVFFSGFNAATVDEKLDAIYGYFSGYNLAADYDEADVKRMLQDPRIVRNPRKICYCIHNGQVMQSIVRKYGAFDAYLEHFGRARSFQDLMLLREDLMWRFKGLGPITVYHFLTDIGLPVLKPDRVICRIFRRLGLIESDEHHLKAITEGRKFAEATGHPIRYIDIVFVKCGQVQSPELGIDRGICLKRKPQCRLCALTEYCNYWEGREKQSTARQC